MPDYQLTLFFRDSQLGETTRSFKGTFADEAAAGLARDAAIAAYAAASGSHVYKWRLSSEGNIAGAPSTESVFMQAEVNVTLSGGTKDNIYIPAPVPACFAGGGNAVDIGATQVTGVVDVVGTGGDGWTMSDGETVDTINKGERIYVNSGKTNLPS